MGIDKEDSTPKDDSGDTEVEYILSRKQASSEEVNAIVDRRIDALLLQELDRWEELLDRDEAPTPPGLVPNVLSPDELDELLRESHGFND